MHKAVLSAVVAAALFTPATAQQINMNGQPGSGQEMQTRPVPIPDAPHPGRAISPELLSSHQIRDIQQALEARGATATGVDGQWSPDMEAAILKFQKSENLISQTGELDPLTLMALGLNPMSFGLSGATETAGRAARDSATRQEGEPIQQVPGHESE